MQTENIKKGWKRVKLGEVLEKIVGGGTPSKSNEKYWNGNIYWCSVKDMPEGKYKIDYTQDKITDLGLKNSSSNLIPKGTIIISTRMGLGRGFINNIDMAINQDLKALFPNKKIDNLFLLRLYINKGNEIEKLGQGTTVKGIRLEDLKNFEITIPESIQTQQKIASILSKYDDLIENNNKRIKILEQTAQEIYKEWFVKFRFPGYENVNMVDSGTEFGEIPEGWEVKSILDVDYFRFINENIKKFEGKKNYYATADIDGINITGKGEYINYDKKPSRAQKKPITYSVWFARMQETYKILGFTYVNNEIAENSILSSGMIGFKCDEFIFPFLFFTINSMNFHKLKDLYCTGATQRALTNDGLKQIKIISPNIGIINLYGKINLGLVNEIFLLQKQNQNLKQTRDILIPKLVSGEVDVDDLDIKI